MQSPYRDVAVETLRPQTAAEQLRHARRRFASQPALYTPQGWLTFGDLGTIADRAAEVLAAAGASFGDRVTLYLENSAILRVLEHAILSTGMVRVALSPRLHPSEVAAIAEDCTARLVCCAPELADAMRAALLEAGSSAQVIEFSDTLGPHTPAALRSASIAASSSSPVSATADWPVVTGGDVAMLMYSSGTTGRPKGAIVTHASWVDHTERSLGHLPKIDPGDVVLAVAPMTHFGGTIGLDCALRGAATVPMAGFDPSAVLAALDTHAVTILPLVPILLTRLVDAASAAGIRPRPLRAVPYGGSVIAADALARASDYFPGALIQFYGLAEALVPLACLTARDHDAAAKALAGPLPEQERARSRLSSCGRWVSGVETRVQGGQLRVRGKAVMAGYWNRPELTSEAIDEDGWFSTGDVVRVDDEGYVHIVDRLGDMIISGGFNIYPGEVERVIAEIGGIREVTVLGAPDERWGEGVHAAVVLAEEAPDFAGTKGQANLFSAVTDACRSRLAGYKKPLAVHVVDEIPRNAAGKVDRARLRTMLWPEPAAQDRPVVRTG